MNKDIMIIDCIGGRSIDTINDSDFDKTLCKIATMQKYNRLKSYYNLDKTAFNFLFSNFKN